MEKDKKSFILYNDQRMIVDQLSDEQAGVLLKIIFSYVDGEQTDINNPLVKLAYTVIKNQIDRDQEKWELTKQKRSEAGKKGGRPKKDVKETLNNKAKKANGFSEKQTKAKKAVNVNGNVNVNVNDNVIQKEKYIKESNFDFNHDKLMGIHKELINTHKLDAKKLLSNNGELYKTFLKWIVYMDVDINVVSKVEMHLKKFTKEIKNLYTIDSIIAAAEHAMLENHKSIHPKEKLPNHENRERLSDYIKK